MSNCINIFSTVNSYTNPCRFCYSYTPPGTVENCCPPTICATNEFLSSLSAIPAVVNNSKGNSEQSLLLYAQQQYLQETNNAITQQIIQSTILNSSIIASTVYGQLLQVQRERYIPYQPYMPPVIPSSVIQLQMATVNVGVPHSFFTYSDCKGVQSVTT
jgi:hypothetical protein